jgi:uncharacterized protein (TIGR03083 family)
VLKPAEPVNVVELLQEERAELLALLRGLTAEQWALPTVCPGWSVGDIARHLLGDDLGRLSRIRDSFRQSAPPELSIVQLVNERNAEWVTATRRLSPRLVRELLAVTGEWTHAHFVTLDLGAIGSPVSWAGPAPVWLDVAREYTERWHHQQQIRDAVGASDLLTPRLFAPVLATFVFALPHTFRDTPAAEGSTVHLRISGDSGRDWSLQRERGAWRLYTGAPERPTSRVTLHEQVAWRLFTRGLAPEQAAPHATVEGDPVLGRQVLETVSVIA